MEPRDLTNRCSESMKYVWRGKTWGRSMTKAIEAGQVLEGWWTVRPTSFAKHLS